MKINGAPGKIGSMSPSVPIAINTPEATHRTTVAVSKRELSREAARLVQVGCAQLLAVPRFIAHVRPRLDAPTFRRAHVDVLVPAVARDAAGTVHAELHE